MTTTTASAARFDFDGLVDYSEAAEARRARTYKAGAEPCYLCGRKVVDGKGWWVHMATDLTLFPVAENHDADGDSQGWWILGSECARKIPMAFRNH